LNVLTIISFCLPGLPNILTAYAENAAGLTGSVYSQSVLQDNSEPLAGTVECHKFIQVLYYDS